MTRIENLRRYHHPGLTSMAGLGAFMVLYGAIDQEPVLAVLGLTLAGGCGWFAYRSEKRWRADGGQGHA